MKYFRFGFIVLLVATFSFAAMAQVPTSGLQLWLKADEGVTLNGTTVSTWIDQSGNGNNAVQTTVSRQPLFVDNVVNGKPVIHFDGIDDHLSLSSSTSMSSISIFVVFKIDSGLVGNPTSDPLPYYPIALNGYGLAMRNFFSNNSPNIIDPYMGESSWVQAEAPNIAAFDRWKVVSVVTDQNMWNTTLRSNGVDAVITPEGTSGLPLSVTLGRLDGSDGIGGADNVPAGHLIFKGDIAEVVVYNSVLSESEKDSVENYLAEKYNISNSPLPTAGLQLWLKADKGVTLNGSTVSTWIDQSGNGNNAVQTTVSRQPLLVDNAVNGIPVIQFDGIDDRLSLTGSTTMSRISLFMVFKVDSGLIGLEGTDPLPYYPINLNGYGLAMRNFFSNNSPNIIDPYAGLESWVQAEAPNIAAYDQWKVVSVIADQNMWNTTLRSNGVDAVITPEGTSSLPLSITLGRLDGSDGIGGADNVAAGHLIFKGDIAEVILYDSVLSESKRDSVESYLTGKYNVVTAVQEPQGQNIPERFSLQQNYPNPFNPSTTIKYEVSNSSFVTLKVYDILGREVASLVNEQKTRGSYSVNFVAAKLSSGVYFYQIKATPLGGQAGNPSTGSGQGFVQTKKMILLK